MCDEINNLSFNIIWKKRESFHFRHFFFLITRIQLKRSCSKIWLIIDKSVRTGYNIVDVKYIIFVIIVYGLIIIMIIIIIITIHKV